MDEEFQTCSSVQVGYSSPESSEKPIKKVKNIFPKRRDCIAIKEKLMKIVNKEEYKKTLIAYLHGSCSKEFFDEKMNSILTTPTAKIMHNELIRSILFNAHFTMTPPPNVEVPPPPIPRHLGKGNPSLISYSSSFSSNTANPISNFLRDNSNHEANANDKNSGIFPVNTKKSFLDATDSKSNTAYNMRHLPSIYQLTSRVENLALEKQITSVDINAVKLIFQQLKELIIILLKDTLVFHQNKNDNDNNNVDINSMFTDSEEQESLINIAEVLSAIETDSNLFSFISVSVMNKYYSLV